MPDTMRACDRGWMPMSWSTERNSWSNGSVTDGSLSFFSSKNCSSFWTSLSYDATVLADKPFSNDKWALKSSTNVALSGNSVIAVLKNTDSFINFADVPGESCCNKDKQFRRKNLDNPKTKRL